MPTKFKHEDGTETILKVKHYKYDESTLQKTEVKKDFVTLFVSVSNGCNIGCKLCFLTYSKCLNKYNLLTPDDIISNNKSICEKLRYNSIKVSFMGMGEGILHHTNLKYISESIADNKLYAAEVGTMLPFVSHSLEESLNSLKNGRVFFSLHSAVQSSRDKLISSKVSLCQAKEFLQSLKIKKVCHYTLIKNINDSDSEIREAIKYCSDIEAQLRILEFNKIGQLEPTERKLEVTKLLSNECNNYKLCYSSGKRMKAACGMFF
jgi:adenine C2-methylase RlmN of 23S rRNA A2503 and tRNA A37